MTLRLYMYKIQGVYHFSWYYYCDILYIKVKEYIIVITMLYIKVREYIIIHAAALYKGDGVYY